MSKKTAVSWRRGCGQIRNFLKRPRSFAYEFCVVAVDGATSRSPTLPEALSSRDFAPHWPALHRFRHLITAAIPLPPFEIHGRTDAGSPVLCCVPAPSRHTNEAQASFRLSALFVHTQCNTTSPPYLESCNYFVIILLLFLVFIAQRSHSSLPTHLPTYLPTHIYRSDGRRSHHQLQGWHVRCRRMW
jgi:hypothetical protein